MSIKEFLLNNEDLLKDYFQRVKVSNEKTEIKVGWNDTNIGITFLIKGDLNKELTSFEDKINALFNTTTNIEDLNEKIKEFEKYSFITQAPFLKISKENEPQIHAFSISIKKNIEE